MSGPLDDDDVLMKKEPQHDCVVHARVVIVGAGAAGIQCAHDLLSKTNHDDDDETDDNHDSSLEQPVCILEARDRIGGRIHTVHRTVPHLTDHKNTTNDAAYDHDLESSTRVIGIDEGAAWVHGTGHPWPSSSAPPPSSDISSLSTHQIINNTAMDEDLLSLSNPIVKLLDQITPPDKNACHEHLIPTVRNGNPWMRPRHVLHAPLIMPPQNKDVIIPETNTHHDRLCRDHVALYRKGKRLDPTHREIPQALALHEQIFHAVSKVGNAAYQVGEGLTICSISVQDAIATIRHHTPQLQYRSDNVEALVQFYSYMMTGWFGCTLSEVQLSEFVLQDDNDVNRTVDENHVDTKASVSDHYREVGDFPGPHCTVKRGMTSILEPLLEQEGVRESIRLQQEVIQIQHRKEAKKVQVTCASGLVVEADACVITLPLGCLQATLRANATRSDTNITNKTKLPFFDPPLSDTKIEGIMAMHMGSYKKVILTFDHIFWPTEEPFLGLIRDGDDSSTGLGTCLWMDNLWAKDGIPMVEVVLFPAAAQWATGKSDSILEAAILKFMTEAGLSPTTSIEKSFVSSHVTRWEEDPYSRGTFSYYGLGTLDRHCDALGEPEWDGCLVLAGEATNSEWQGSVHGALQSGTEAAEQITSFLSKT